MPAGGNSDYYAALGLGTRAELEHLRSQVLALLRAELQDPALADDLCQDAFRIVLERLARQPLEDPSRLGAYLAQTARYLAIGHHKRVARHRTVTGHAAAIEAVADPAVAQEQALQLDARARAVRQVLKEMRQTRDREILVRVYLYDHGKAAVCRELGISEDHYKRVLHRARARFAELLEGRYRRSDLFCSALF